MAMIETIKKKQKKLSIWLKPINGIAVFIEFAVLVGINYFLLMPKYFPIDSLKDTIKSLTTTEIITILTASVIAVGFLYYIGYIAAAKLNGLNIRLPLQYIVSFHGSLFFLGVFLPIAYAVLSAFGQLNFFVFILVIVIFVVGVGFLNESLIYRENPNPEVTLIMSDVDKTSNGEKREGLKYYETRNVDYLFKDENENIILIPIAQVKEIRFHKDKEVE